MRCVRVAEMRCKGFGDRELSYAWETVEEEEAWWRSEIPFLSPG